MKERLCVDCDTDISERGHNSVRCVPCQKTHEKARRAAYDKTYRSLNLDRLKTQQARRYRTNRDAKREYDRKYRQTTRGRAVRKLAQQKRRSRKRNQLGKVSPQVIDLLLERQQNRCAGPDCGKHLQTDVRDGYHVDHIVALSAGGLTSDDNLQILCPDCNNSKRSREPDAWLQDMGQLPLMPSGDVRLAPGERINRRYCENPTCENEITDKMSRAKYCSQACGGQVWYRNNREKNRQKARRHYARNRDRITARARERRAAKRASSSGGTASLV